MPTAGDLANQMGDGRHRELTCAVCGKEFLGARTHAECMEEAEDVFGEAEAHEEDLAVVCDDCWHRIKPSVLVVGEDGALLRREE